MAKGISLHIGVNEVDPGHYAGWAGPLVACEADAEDMHAISKQHRFASTVLKTSEATRTAVSGAIKDAAKILDRGDIFFISYSGHGGQLPDRNGDEKDLKDETWCLFDGQLLDDELLAMWSQFRSGVRVLVLSDSCHSGTVTRAALGLLQNATPALATLVGEPPGGPVRYRFMPESAAFRTYRANRGFYDELGATAAVKSEDLKASVRLISGCQDNQVSLDGAFNGLFTGTLLRVWNQGRFKGDYGQFHREILQLMPPTQSPNHYVIGPNDPSFDRASPFAI